MGENGVGICAKGGAEVSDLWKDRVEIGDAVLYHGDCLEILPTLPKMDAVVTE